MVDQESLNSIESLHRMKAEGIISEDEFERSKQRILFGGKSSQATAHLHPAEDDHLSWALLPIRRYADFAG